MITGSAPTGSSTPPICEPAEMWQFFPIWAQLPTSACESTMVPSPTYAPVLMYMGGMQVTPLPTKQPSRILEPPGTMRTPDCAVNCFTGYVDLSKNGWRVESIDISTTAPMRNPSRMPFLTQPFTRQPLLAAVSASAARMAPAFSASLKRLNNRKCSSVYFSGFSSKSFSISACNAHSPVRKQSNAVEHFFDFGEILGLGRTHGQAIYRVEQFHQPHGGLNRNRVRFDEVDLHQREVFPLQLTCP